MVDELDDVYTPKEVAQALKLAEKSVLQYLREGRLPGFRVGKHWRVRRADLAALVQPTPRPVLVAPVAQEVEADADAEPEAHPHLTPDLIDPQQRRAALVGRLQALRAKGLTLREIAMQMNVEGVPTISGKGQWQAGTVGNLLQEGEV
jgi:excisionase family DNA binding protein